MKLKISRLTFNTIYQNEEAIPIRNKTRKSCNFCVGADLNESDTEAVVFKEDKVKKVKKIKVIHSLLFSLKNSE